MTESGSSENGQTISKPAAAETAAGETKQTEAPAKKAAPRKSSGGLGGKVLAELQVIAADLGISNISSMRKGALIDAIKAARGETTQTGAAAQTLTTQIGAAPLPAAQTPTSQALTSQPSTDNSSTAAEKTTAAEPVRDGGVVQPALQTDEGGSGQDTAQTNSQQDPVEDKEPSTKKAGKNDAGRNNAGKKNSAKNDGRKNDGAKNDQNGDNAANSSNSGQSNRGQGGSQGNSRNKQNSGNQDQRSQDQTDNMNQSGDDDDNGQTRRRNRRGRNRNRGMDADPTYAEDDVLVPAAGILDVLDNYAFVRTTGYQPSDQDVYVSLSMVRKWGLRRGDAITGQVRQPREGERKEKFNPMVKVESVNGLSLDDAARRVEFAQLVPVHPTQRLSLATSASSTSGRLVDLLAPIGKGQRGLIVAPPNSGRTTLLHDYADALTINHPDCHLMVVLVDERPEEVTDFSRSVKGEVISSPFDRPAGDHTTVAELAIERAKRLVELGHDVVVLVDGLSRLGRAYQQVAAQSTRGNSNNAEAVAQSSAKQFFGAARNVEDGGSLTIIATVGADTGSEADVAMYSELVGTQNSEVRLNRTLADRNLFPAIDVTASSTRRVELLLDDAEAAAMVKVRSHLATLDEHAALLLVREAITATETNAQAVQKLQLLSK